MLTQIGQRFQACAGFPQLRDLAESIIQESFGSDRQRVLFWEEVSTPQPWLSNPVVDYFRKVQCAVHEAHVVDPETWKSLCPRADHSHVLVGPIVLRGQLLGALAATRGPERPFGQDDLNSMNRLSLHFSTRWSELLHSPAGLDLSSLTAREQEVCWWVCQGLRNRQIGERLAISEHTVKQRLKAVFQKLNLRSRTELQSRWR